MSSKTKFLIAFLISSLLPGLALGALAGVNYQQVQPGGAQQNAAPAGGGGQQAPSAEQVSSATGGGGGGGGTTSGGGTPSQKGNVNAVSAILHPGPKEGQKKDLGPPEPMDNAEVEGRVMDNSINSYPGRCACPYSRNSDGFECGVEAAYYKPGGYRIYCYPEDVRGQLNIFYRKTH